VRESAADIGSDHGFERFSLAHILQPHRTGIVNYWPSLSQSLTRKDNRL
jgi:hypothetical protein